MPQKASGLATFNITGYIALMQPFRCHSIYQPRIWGGQKMRTALNRDLPDHNESYGEAWEISDREEAMSTIRDGEWAGKTLHSLWTEHRQEIFGPGYDAMPHFPLLCKILDARENLSVQVHPPARTAQKWNGDVKNEIWYILQAEPEAVIYSGMDDSAPLTDIRRAAETGGMERLLHAAHLNRGEHVYIPSGLVHAIGAGYLIAEIQQNSDTTYRLYDWNRKDASGRGRDLHLKQSLDSIEEFRALNSNPAYLTDMPHFTISEYRLRQGEQFTQEDAAHFAVLAILQGAVAWDGLKARQGEFIISPVHALPVTAAEPDTVILTVTACTAPS